MRPVARLKWVGSSVVSGDKRKEPPCQMRTSRHTTRAPSYWPRFATQSASDAEALGEDFQDLVNQIRGLCRRIESVNYTTLPDLGYEPSN